jgi:hypothetical protein
MENATLISVDIFCAEEVADRLERLQKVALKTRRYIHLAADFNDWQDNIFFQARIANARWKESSKTDLLASLDHVIKLGDKPLPEGWIFDAEKVAQELLAIYSLAKSDKRIISISFRGDFRKVRDNRLFKTWIKGKNPKGKYHDPVLYSGVRSHNAYASLSQARSEAKVLLEQYPTYEEIMDIKKGQPALVPF